MVNLIRDLYNYIYLYVTYILLCKDFNKNNVKKM